MMAFADYKLATGLLLSLDVLDSSGVWARLLPQPSQAGGATKPCMQTAWGLGSSTAAARPSLTLSRGGAGELSGPPGRPLGWRIFAEVAPWIGEGGKERHGGPGCPVPATLIPL